jgi:hypothetical protein
VFVWPPRDPVGSDLNRGRELHGKIRPKHRERAEGPGLLGQRPYESQFIERWGAQVIDQTTDLGDGLLGLNRRLVELLTCFRRIHVHMPARTLQTENDAGQTGAQAVVKFAAQPASLFLRGCHQAFSRAQQIPA